MNLRLTFWDCMILLLTYLHYTHDAPLWPIFAMIFLDIFFRLFATELKSFIGTPTPRDPHP